VETFFEAVFLATAGFFATVFFAFAEDVKVFFLEAAGRVVFLTFVTVFLAVTVFFVFGVFFFVAVFFFVVAIRSSFM